MVYAMLYNMYGTVNATKGMIRDLISGPPFHGSVEFPPIMAQVSIAKAGLRTEA
jgi:hypothetical protein